MSQTTPPAQTNTEDLLVITRTFDAPRDLVFGAWTEPERLARWWGPKGAEIRIVKFDLAPGGLFHYCMTSQGQQMWGRFVYREVVAPERLVFVNAFSDAQGGVTANPWMPDWPLEVLNTLTFEESEGKTTLTLRGTPLNATAVQMETFRSARTNVQQGFAGTFDQLAAHLEAAAREITTSRMVDAPRELVFRAFTDPALVVNWWGPNGFTTTVQEMDVRPGGNWRFIMHGPDGTDYDNHHVYVEVVSPERLVLDHVCAPKHRATWTFEDAGGGRTRVSLRMVFESVELRDGVVRAFNAIEGAQQTVARLAQYLRTM